MSAALVAVRAAQAGGTAGTVRAAHWTAVPAFVIRGAGGSSMPKVAPAAPPWAALLAHLDRLDREAAPRVVGPWTRDELYERRY